ncbi:MAG: hypothetical protein WCS78_05770, partial [Bacilli bacterium]
MEFREYIVDYFKKENKTINIKSFLQKYTESFETDIDIIQYIQVIGLIRNRDSKIDFITRMVNAYNNRSLLGEISQISTEFDKMKISSHIYSYFLYC